MPRAFLKAREPFSSYSHFIGAVLSGAGLFVLLVRLLFDSSVTGSLAAAAVVFCLSLIALYSASSVSFAAPSVTPALSGLPPVSAPEPAFTSRQSEWPW